MEFERYVLPMLRPLARRDWLQRPLNRLLAPMNPMDPRRYTDPYPVYEEVRSAGGPLFYHRRVLTWLATGYDECERILRGPVSVDRTDLLSKVSPYSKVLPRTRELFLSTMLMTDPPDHARLRALVNRAFTPRAVAALEPRVQEIADELISDLDAGVVDVMEVFASRLPIYAIGEMIGLPPGRREELKTISDMIAHFADPLTGFDPGHMDAAVAAFEELLGELIRDRQTEPSDDLLSGLLAAEEDGDRLSHSELVSMVLLLMVAGHETTSNLIGNSLVALDRDRAARERLLAEPEIAGHAVEEFLRFDTPVQGSDRLVLDDFTVGDHVLPAGATVVVFLAAANRDPRRYEAPGKLQLDRPDPRPLSFGHGVHHCLGAALARLEAKIAIPTFTSAFPNSRVLAEKLEWKRSITLRGPATLPIQLRPAC